MYPVRILEEAAAAYAEQPLDFSNENDLQAYLYEQFRGTLRTRGELYTDWTSNWDSPVDCRHDRQYLEPYHTTIENLAQSSSQTLSRVRTELLVWHPLSDMMDDEERPLEGTDELLDVAILRNPMDRPIQLINGKHRFEIEMVDTAIELKYPRQQPKVPCSLPRYELDDATDDELYDAVDLDRLDLRDDIDELEGLGAEYAPHHFIFLCSQYDILRRGATTTTQQHDRLADAAVAKLNDYCNHTSLIYAYPDGWEWIVDNT